MENRNSSTKLVIIVLVIVVAVGLGIVFLGMNKSTPNTANTEVEGTTTDTSTDSTPSSAQNSSSSTDSSSTDSSTTGTTSTATYTDGTYSANGTYDDPQGTETIGVKLTVSGGVVKAVSITPDTHDVESYRYQQQFISGVAAVVVGKKLDQAYINGRVNGSSLTPGGFNNALDSIVSQAKVS